MESAVVSCAFSRCVCVEACCQLMFCGQIASGFVTKRFAVVFGFERTSQRNVWWLSVFDRYVRQQLVIVAFECYEFAE